MLAARACLKQHDCAKLTHSVFGNLLFWGSICPPMRIFLRPGAANVFGPALKRAREASRQKITQEDIAARLTTLGLPMDRTIVSRIENQRRAITDIELLYFTRALRINMERLIQFALTDPSAIPFYSDIAADEDSLELRVAEETPEIDPTFK